MPHPVDILVGTNIRMTRRAVGLSQKQLGEILGVSFQQIQKYEKASNRISASRLWEIGKAFGVDVPHFFKGVDSVDSGQIEILPDRTIKLAGQINQISSEGVRNQIISLVKACAN